jgi:hypothetical protein
MMQEIGPPLESLTRRLAETPADFLDEPKIGTKGRIFVAALVGDLLLRFGGTAEARRLGHFHSNNAHLDRNRLALAAIAVWLLSDEWFVTAKIDPEQISVFLDSGIGELASANAAHHYVTDADRREELVRTALARLGFRPEGETVAQASDRLTSISGVERQRLLAASRAAEERAREVREALAQKAAQESADKWTRE